MGQFTCVNCGELFEARRGIPKPLYCSWACSRHLPLYKRTCVECGRAFTTRHADTHHCCRACQRAGKKVQARPTLGRVHGLPTSAVGAMAELLVAADLIRQGFYVFRAVGAHGPCDLVVFRRGEPCLKIEVKSGVQIRKDGKTPVFGSRYEYDNAALVQPDGTVVYFPLLPPITDVA